MYKTIRKGRMTGSRVRRSGQSVHSVGRLQDRKDFQASSMGHRGIRGKQNHSIQDLSRGISGARPHYSYGYGYGRSSYGRSYWRYYNQNRSATLGSRNSPVWTRRRPATRKYDAIEDLSGITRQRPEIVMVTEFHPLFQKERAVDYDSYWSAYWWARSYARSQLTEHGKFADAKFNVDSINRSAIGRIWRRIWRARRGGKSMRKRLARQRKRFLTKIRDMRRTANFMLQLLRVIENTKDLFDLRDVRHTAKYSQNKHDDYNAGQVTIPNDKSQYKRSEFLDFTEKNLPAHNSIASTLEQYGFNRSSVDTKFTSTKIWCQAVNEFKVMMEHHSQGLLDRTSYANQNDQHPTALPTPWLYTRLGLYERLGTTTIPSIAGITNALPEDLYNIIKNINTAYWRLGWDYGINNSTKIAAWLWLFSKEYRFSNGLAKPEVRAALRNGFGYDVSSVTNDNLFDVVFGERTYAIDQAPVTIGSDLYSLAYERPDTSTVVMNFESKYLEGHSGILTPGSEYYIDDVLDNFGEQFRPSDPTNPESRRSDYRFNTERLKGFIKRLDDTRNNLDAVANGMNFLAHWRADDRKSKHWERGIAHPPTFYHWMTDTFVDLKKHRMDKKYSSDAITAILHLASRDRGLKSAIFTYLLQRIKQRGTSSTAQGAATGRGDKSLALKNLEYILYYIRRNIRRAKLYTRFPPFYQNSSLGNNVSENTIHFYFNSRHSPTWQKIEEVFHIIYAALKDRDQVIRGDRTRYSGVLDTVMMMLAFDTLISIFEKYSELRVNTSQRNIAYAYTSLRTRSTYNYLLIQRREINRNETRREYNKVLSRLFAERRRCIRGYIALVSTIDVIRGNMQALVNYLESRNTRRNINDLIALTPGFEDPRFLRLLFNQQQMMLVASGIYDTVKHLQRFYLSPDMDGDGDSEQDDMFDVLDENVVTPHARRLFMTTFGDQQFADLKGNNKQILTVGLPLGFVEKFNQLIDTEGSSAKPFNAKQNDIVKIKVYKTDMRHPEVIFKPQEFLFEMSRFPVRVASAHLKLKPTATFEDVVNAVATRDLLQDPHTNGDTIYYGDTSDANINSDGYKPRSAQVRQALSGDDYEFLDDEEKRDILTNTVLSYMLELYIKVMTDLNVHDYKFHMRPQDAQRRITEELVQDIVRTSLTDAIGSNEGAQLAGRIASRSGGRTSRALRRRTKRSGVLLQRGRLFGRNNWSSQITRSGVAGSGRIEGVAKGKTTRRDKLRRNSQTRLLQPDTINDLLSRMSSQQMPRVLTELRSINQLANAYSPLTDPDAAARTYFSPRRYDRVFNIMVDPDDFEIDVDKTLATPYGKSVMEELIRDGEVEDLRFRRFRHSRHRRLLRLWKTHWIQRGSWRPIYKQKPRDKGEGDVIFEKWFVTVETYGEADV